MNTPSLPLSRLLAHAADAVSAVRAGQSLTEALAACPDAARPGTQALSFQALRHLGRAEALRRQLVPRAPAPWVDALLLTALALAWDPDQAPYPEHTLVDQAVEAIKRRDRGRSAFVNAVLRRFLRERGALVIATGGDPVARWNHPRWWIERLRQDWPDRWEAILAAANRHPPMTLRANARHLDGAALAQRLNAAGLPARAVGEGGPHAVVLGRPVPVQAIPGFAAGEVSVQDLAAQWAAPLLLGEGLPAGARVLDACAAPGGKSGHILERAPGIELTALDIDAGRLQRVQENLDRLGFRANLIAADLLSVGWWDGALFDRILLDAPCSGTGVIRRHPDIKLLRRADDIHGYAATQLQLLERCAGLLREGGRLVYATCSVLPTENQELVDRFLSRHREFTRVSPDVVLLPVPRAAGPAAVTDGFFYATLTKGAA